MNDEFGDGDRQPAERHKLGAGEGNVLVTPGVLDREAYEAAKAAGDGAEIVPRSLDRTLTLDPRVTTRPDLGTLTASVDAVTLEPEEILAESAGPQRTTYVRHTGGDPRRIVANFRDGGIVGNTENVEHPGRLGTPARLRVLQLTAAQCERHVEAGRLVDAGVQQALLQHRQRLLAARSRVRLTVLAEIEKEVAADLTISDVLRDAGSITETSRLLDRIRDRDRLLRAVASESAPATGNPEGDA